MCVSALGPYCSSRRPSRGFARVALTKHLSSVALSLYGYKQSGFIDLHNEFYL